MNIGQWFIEGGTMLEVWFPKNQGLQQAGNILVQLGTWLEGTEKNVGPIRVGDEGITFKREPWTGA